MTIPKGLVPDHLIERMLNGEFNSRSGFIAVPNPASKRPHGCRSCDAPGSEIVGYDASGGYACQRHMSWEMTWGKGKIFEGNQPPRKVSEWVRAEQYRRSHPAPPPEPPIAAPEPPRDEPADPTPPSPTDPPPSDRPSANGEVIPR